MEIYLPDEFDNLYFLFQKRKMKILRINIIKLNNSFQLELIQFINNQQKLYYKKSIYQPTLSSFTFAITKNEFQILPNNSQPIIIKNKTDFSQLFRILSNSNKINFINYRQKIETINENTFIYLLKTKYEPKYDFQFILNNLNLINNTEFIQGKRQNNTYSFHLKIEKNNKSFKFTFNNQDENANWGKKKEFFIELEDEKLHLKFHKSNNNFCLTINDQKSFFIPKNYFYNLDYFDISTSLHDAIVMLPDEEQIIFKEEKEKNKKHIHYWVDKKRYDEKTTIFQFIHLDDNIGKLRDEYQIKLAEKWASENIKPIIKNFCLFNLNPIKKILYFSRGYGRHRFGWDYVCKEVFLKNMADDPDGILLDPFIEATFLWKMKISQGDFFYSKPWVGFLHSSPTTPVWYNSAKNSLMDLLTNKNFKKSIPNCKALFVLSNHLNTELKNRLKYLNEVDIPIFTLYHPAGNPSKIFQIDNYEKNSVLHIGLHLRNFGSFYLLNPTLKKYLIIPTEINWQEDVYHFIFYEISKTILDFETTIQDFKNQITCYEKHLINDNDYDQLLSKHILFCDFYDASANNLIVECIMSQTPILVNKNPAIIEYLGDEYPFYFNTIEEANEKATNEELISKTHHYLKTRQYLVNIYYFKQKWAEIINQIH